MEIVDKLRDPIALHCRSMDLRVPRVITIKIDVRYTPSANRLQGLHGKRSALIVNLLSPINVNGSLSCQAYHSQHIAVGHYRLFNTHLKTIETSLVREVARSFH